MTTTLLIAHTDREIGDELAEMAELLGMETISVSCGREVVDYLVTSKQHRPDAIILSSELNDKSPIELVNMIKRTGECIPVIVYANSPADSLALQALKVGADDYLYPPMTLARFRVTLFNALSNREMKQRTLKHTYYGYEPGALKDVIGNSDAMCALRKFIEISANHHHSVVLSGESGVGKTMAAKLVHAQRHQTKAPFVTLKGKIASNKPVFIDNVLKPAIEAAKGGTLYINGVEHMSHESQLFLVAALKSAQNMYAPIRLIVSSCSPLKYAYAAGQMCNELYTLLSRREHVIPALRERAEDIPLLVQHYTRKICLEENIQLCSLDADNIKQLESIPWLGNVRELLFVLRRSLILQDMTMFEQWSNAKGASATYSAYPELSNNIWSLPDSAKKQHKALSLFKTDGSIKCIDDLEAETIAFALDHYNGCMSEVARRLGIGRSTLYRKISDYNISNVA